MPPTRKRQKTKNLPAKLGRVRHHLTDNFADLPTVGDVLLNGHVLFIYTENERVISRTITAHLSPHGVSMYDMKKLGKTLDKYRHL